MALFLGVSYKCKNIFFIHPKIFIMSTESKGLSGAAYRETTSTDSKDLSKVLFGALAGAAAGSIIGVLFTEKGIETRKRLGEGTRNMASNLKDKVSDITAGIADKYA